MTIAEQTADLEALYQADEKLEREHELDRVLQALVDIAVDLLGADKSAVLAWDDGRKGGAGAWSYGWPATSELKRSAGSASRRVRASSGG